LDLAAWREVGASTRELPDRVDRTFTFERVLSQRPELRERAVVRIAGDTVVSAARGLIVPPRAVRAARSREAPRQALVSGRLRAVRLAVAGAFAVFIVSLRNGAVRLRQAAFWSGVTFLCFLGTHLLQQRRLLDLWDPLWPRGVSLFQHLIALTRDNAWTFGVLLAVIAAGDALDRRRPPHHPDNPAPHRGASLWLLGAAKLRTRWSAWPRCAVFSSV
jgi:hypothetical protein